MGKPEKVIKQYCQHCGHETRHTVETRGRDEVYTCKVCKYQVWYRVK
jgi:transcription elongation factor Elf1